MIEAETPAWDFNMHDMVVVIATGKTGRVIGQSRFRFPGGIYCVECPDEPELTGGRWHGPLELRAAGAYKTGAKVPASLHQMRSKKMELQDLVGKHQLDGVDFENLRRKRYEFSDELEDCEVCRFRLNGTVYVAIEDPNDGYRSHMSELSVDDAATMTNVFPPVEVVGRYRETSEYGYVDDVLELVDATTGNVVLEVGTSNTDDYYPFFVSSFHPENMAINTAA